MNVRKEQTVIEELARKVRQYRLQAIAMAKLVDASKANENFKRCSGLAKCEVCYLQYYDHPHNESLNLYLACNGEWLHL